MTCKALQKQNAGPEQGERAAFGPICTSSPVTYLLGDWLISVEVCPAEATQPTGSLRMACSEMGRATFLLKPRVSVGGSGKEWLQLLPTAPAVPEPQSPQSHRDSSCPQGGSKTSSCSPGCPGSKKQGTPAAACAGLQSEKKGDSGLSTLPSPAQSLPNNLPLVLEAGKTPDSLQVWGFPPRPRCSSSSFHPQTTQPSCSPP